MLRATLRRASPRVTNPLACRKWWTTKLLRHFLPIGARRSASGKANRPLAEVKPPGSCQCAAFRALCAAPCVCTAFDVSMQPFTVSCGAFRIPQRGVDRHAVALARHRAVLHTGAQPLTAEYHASRWRRCCQRRSATPASPWLRALQVGDYRVATVVHLVLIFVIAGLTLDTEEALKAFKRPAGLVTGLVCILGITPMLSFAATHIPFTEPAFAVGFAVFCAMPTTLSSGHALVVAVRPLSPLQPAAHPCSTAACGGYGSVPDCQRGNFAHLLLRCPRVATIHAGRMP